MMLSQSENTAPCPYATGWDVGVVCLGPRLTDQSGGLLHSQRATVRERGKLATSLIFLQNYTIQNSLYTCFCFLRYFT